MNWHVGGGGIEVAARSTTHTPRGFHGSVILITFAALVSSEIRKRINAETYYLLERLRLKMQPEDTMTPLTFLLVKPTDNRGQSPCGWDKDQFASWIAGLVRFGITHNVAIAHFNEQVGAYEVDYSSDTGVNIGKYFDEMGNFFSLAEMAATASAK